MRKTMRAPYARIACRISIDAAMGGSLSMASISCRKASSLGASMERCGILRPVAVRKGKQARRLRSRHFARIEAAER